MGIFMAVEMEARQKRTRSPAYPYIPLPAALEKAAVLWQVEGRHAAAVNVAMQHWGYKEESSTGYSCVAALKKFGLVDHEGMGDNRQVRLSGLALSILLDKNPDSAERRDALRAAALGPRIHAELWERYGSELPSDQSLRRFLVVERSFNETAVDELLDEYKVTMAFAGLPVGTGVGEGVPARPSATVAATVAPAALPPTALAAPLRSVTPPAVAPSAELPVMTAAAASNGREHRRSEMPPNAPRPVARPSAAPEEGGHAGIAVNDRKTAMQRHLFGDDEDAGIDSTPGVAGSVYEEMFAAAGGRGRDESVALREGGGSASPWSVARRELPVPLDNGLVARVPYPMTEEDFLLLIDTLQLWKKRLVHPNR